jgi:hypothetical protein
MDSERFDGLVRSFSQSRSRRQALRTLAGVAAGAVALGGAAAVEAGRCKNGTALCGKGKNACVDKQTDVNHCGSCGNQCGTGSNNGLPCCHEGRCTSLNDPHTCGNCDNNCFDRYPPSQCIASVSCQSQTCNAVINTNGSCNGGCGSCNSISGACDPLPNGTPCDGGSGTCTGGGCVPNSTS